MRFKLDENLPSEMAALFVEAGHAAVTTLDQQLGGAQDSNIALVCLREGRTLVTLDVDFADIRAYPPRRYPGIVVFRLGKQSRDYLLEIASGLLRDLTVSLQGQLRIVEDSRIRIRE